MEWNLHPEGRIELICLIQFSIQKEALNLHPNELQDMEWKGRGFP
jgi:hypothetical protein